jgi:hypothetical protein
MKTFLKLSTYRAKRTIRYTLYVTFLLIVNQTYAQCPTTNSRRNNGNGGCGGGIDFSVFFEFPGGTCPSLIPDLTYIKLPTGEIFDNTDAITTNNFTTQKSCSGGSVKYCVNVSNSNPNIIQSGRITVRFNVLTECKYGESLPVELTSFKATTDKTQINLGWTTASEIQNDGFDIERSTDGLQFEKIAFVQGQGNTTTESRYQYTDTHVAQGTYYYRLKQWDFDGTYTYSTVVIGSLSEKNYLLASPNPSRGIFTLSGTKQPLHAKAIVYDMYGQSFETRVESNTLDIQTLGAGIYHLKIENEPQVLKLVVQ